MPELAVRYQNRGSASTTIFSPAKGEPVPTTTELIGRRLLSGQPAARGSPSIGTRITRRTRERLVLGGPGAVFVVHEEQIFPRRVGCRKVGGRAGVAVLGPHEPP